jgi:multiple sugar transport system permease protein
MSRGIRGNEARYGWAFTAPAILIIGVFLVLPILLALWVSFSDWNGLGSPLGNSEFVGGVNYAKVLVDSGLAQRDFGTSIRNNLYYVLLVVPLQTALALFLAVQVNRRMLRGRGFFRTAFYFPSVTSSIAITTIFIFLFTSSGAVNQVLGWLGVNGPNWFADPRGVLHLLLGGLGVDGSGAAAAGGPLGLSWWDWFAGPSVAMCVLIVLAIFTTSGTFMLLFLAALQNVGAEIEEAAAVDGAGPFRTFFSVTLPMLKPTLFTVLTLGLIGTWQVFDQIYLTGRGAPAKTLLTPAFLAYDTSFSDLKWGQGAAISFILFGIIVALTLFQRWVLRDRDAGRAGRRREVRSLARLQRFARLHSEAEAVRAAGTAVPESASREGGER